VLERGLATPEEVERARSVQEQLAARSQYKPLLHILVEQHAITPSQAKRVVQEAGTRRKPVGPPGYQILEPVGQGSMGMVYRAKQLSMDRIVALKILRPQLAQNKEFIDRFHREARIAARLSHNNIVQAIDSGEFAGHHYFVMEYVDGTTIKEELESGRVYSEDEALRIIYQIAEALDHAHQRGLIHRDVKPENIMLTRDGTAKLADLGLARLTTDNQLAEAEKGMAMGTPYYIAPEQIRGEVDIDIRADIYSLGATLYHMVTGRVPYTGSNAIEVMQKHLRGKLVPPDHLNTNLSGGLGEVVETMMACDRDHRYASPKDLLIDLKNLMEGKPPIVARKRLDESVMKALAEGEELEGPPPNIRTIQQLTRRLSFYQVATGILSGMLIVALLIIIGLLMQLLSGIE
jgi:serine/threonine-protein kinase